MRSIFMTIVAFYWTTIASPWRKWFKASSSISIPRPGLSGTATWLSVCLKIGSVSDSLTGCGVWSNSVTGSLTYGSLG